MCAIDGVLVSGQVVADPDADLRPPQLNCGAVPLVAVDDRSVRRNLDRLAKPFSLDAVDQCVELVAVEIVEERGLSVVLFQT